MIVGYQITIGKTMVVVQGIGPTNSSSIEIVPTIFLRRKWGWSCVFRGDFERQGFDVLAPTRRVGLQGFQGRAFRYAS
jgi:hypothetical protein